MPKLSTNLDAQNVARMVNVPDPAVDQDVSNKRYTDAAFGKHSVTVPVGDNSHTSFGINHGLNTTNVAIIVKDAATGDVVEADCQATGANTVTVSFTNSPTSNQFNVTIIG